MQGLDEKRVRTMTKAAESQLAAMTERAERAEAAVRLANRALEDIKLRGTRIMSRMGQALEPVLTPEARIADEALTDATISAEVERIKALEKDRERSSDALKPYEWRPIDEIHEDLGPCVLIDINDPGHQESGSNLDSRFDPTQWTHFAEVPKLSGQRANELIAAMKTNAERHSPCAKCGQPRTVAEGGKIFTVRDEYWDAKEKEASAK